ncbi:bacterial Fmu (Sun)/eukaryotic nucleolar NOL1/Nop2p [Tanacetum coccineum]
MIRHPHPQLPRLHPNMLNSKKKVTSSVMETNLHLVNVWNLVKILMPRGCWSSFVDTHQPVSIKELDTYCIDEIVHGTWVCGKRVKPGVFVLLKEGDTVKIGVQPSSRAALATHLATSVQSKLSSIASFICSNILPDFGNGIDATSRSAVLALNISPGDHVLDLCAAPGAKLCMILELLGNSGSVTGVDVARHWLAACRNLIQKYSLGDHCRLFVADRASFSLIPIRAHSKDFGLKGDNDLLYKGWTSRRP